MFLFVFIDYFSSKMNKISYLQRHPEFMREEILRKNIEFAKLHSSQRVVDRHDVL